MEKHFLPLRHFVHKNANCFNTNNNSNGNNNSSNNNINNRYNVSPMTLGSYFVLVQFSKCDNFLRISVVASSSPNGNVQSVK